VGGALGAGSSSASIEDFIIPAAARASELHRRPVPPSSAIGLRLRVLLLGASASELRRLPVPLTLVAAPLVRSHVARHHWSKWDEGGVLWPRL
jgi:hypothetical protein